MEPIQIVMVVGLIVGVLTIIMSLMISSKRAERNAQNMNTIQYHTTTKSNRKCAVDNCRIRVEHSHVIDLCKRIKGE